MAQALRKCPEAQPGRALQLTSSISGHATKRLQTCTYPSRALPRRVFIDVARPAAEEMGSRGAAAKDLGVIVFFGEHPVWLALKGNQQGTSQYAAHHGFAGHSGRSWQEKQVYRGLHQEITVADMHEM